MCVSPSEPRERPRKRKSKWRKEVKTNGEGSRENKPLSLIFRHTQRTKHWSVYIDRLFLFVFFFFQSFIFMFEKGLRDSVCVYVCVCSVCVGYPDDE